MSGAFYANEEQIADHEANLFCQSVQYSHKGDSIRDSVSDMFFTDLTHTLNL